MPAETHVQQGPIDRSEILQLVQDRLADILEIEPAQVSEGDSFAEDLHADSLALIELVEALEEEFGERFLRIHRNCLVARAAVQGVERQGGREGDPHWAVLLEGVSEPLSISRRQWPSVKATLKL